MDECELIAFVTGIACAISKCCSDDEISLMAAIFPQLGDTLATILVQREIRDNNRNENINQDCNNRIENKNQECIDRNKN